MAASRKLLAVNADDFGFSHDVNAGIVEAHARGILTSATIIANAAAFDDAVRLARANPSLDLGVHFVLVGGHSLLDPGRALPSSVGELTRAVLARRLRVYAELRAQIQRIAAAGLHLTHVDTHKHTHLLPPVLNAVARLAEEYGVRWVRRPFDLPLAGSPGAVPWRTRLVSRAFGCVRGHFRRTLARHGCTTTDWFAGFQLTGRIGAASVIYLLDRLPAGSTELMVHPGFCTAELINARTRLKASRERELQALLDPQVRDAVERNGVELVGFGQLPLPA